jgi:prolipoprotein diacylglyceryltransferase
VKPLLFGVSPRRFADLALHAVFGALVGARLVGFVVDYDFPRRIGPQLVSVAQSGGAFLGGLLSALLIFIWYTRRNNLPTWSVTDAAAPGVESCGNPDDEYATINAASSHTDL